MAYLIFEGLLSTDKTIGPIEIVSVNGSDSSLRITTNAWIPELERYIDYVGYPNSYYIPYEDVIFWHYKTYISEQSANQLKPSY